MIERQKQVEQMRKWKEAHYREVVDEYNRISQADPLGCDVCNVNSVLTLTALAKEILAHRATLEELDHLYGVVNALKRELHI